MTNADAHAGHPAIAARLKRAEGHLRAVIGMIEADRPCPEIAQQLHAAETAAEKAAEKAVVKAKRASIHDHMDQCLDADHPPPWTATR